MGGTRADRDRGGRRARAAGGGRQLGADNVQSNGCYKAESPPAYVGQQTIRDVHGHTVTNPLFVVYGCFNTL